MLISYDFTGPAARIVGVKVAPVLQMICAHYRSQRTRKLYEACRCMAGFLTAGVWWSAISWGGILAG